MLFRACRLSGLLLLFVLSSRSATAQFTCPFSEADAIADTLDPKGYYPLEVGIVREYVIASGPYLESLSRTEVVADTLIDGDTFYITRVISFDAARRTVIVDADTSYSFASMLGGVLYDWTPERGRTTSEIPFSRSFNTCHDIGNETNAAVVSGAYDTTYTFREGDVIELAARKEFAFYGIATEEYGYGLGLLSRGADPSVYTTLTYARIDGQEYGLPLDSLFNIRVGAETPSSPGKAHLEIYPNPSAGAATIEVIAERAGRHKLAIYNVLGQRVGLEERWLARGQAWQLGWPEQQNLPSSPYFIRLEAGGQVQTGTLLLVRQEP